MRRSFTLFSVVFHAIAISAALIAQVLAIGPLPTPHQPVIFDAVSIMPADIHLPTPPRRAAPSTPSSTSISAAPIESPPGVAPETGNENVTTTAPVGVIAGVEGGPPSAIEGVGVAVVAPPPPPPPAQPVRVGSGIRAPVKISDVAPTYPVIARTAHVQGLVILEAVLDAQGRVESVRVLRSVPLLDQAAIDAVSQWRYTPTQLNGRPVPVIMTVTVNFTLQ